ncbi:hypothetical protein KDL29_10750 [bacterium]|nr:hypothetical protein [bacterium]
MAGTPRLNGTAEDLQLELSGMRDARAAYVEVHFDPQRWQLQRADVHDLRSGQSLSLAAELEPGVLQLGSILVNPQEATGLDGTLLLADLSFAPLGGSIPARHAASVSFRGDAAPLGTIADGTDEITWLHTNPGDYDQNGLVSISDLTPLGFNFGASGPFDVNSAKSVVDGDGNGMINISDISPIGANFGNQVTEYRLYSSTDIADFPQQNDSQPGGETLEASLAMASAVGSPVADRLLFSSGITYDPLRIYWVRASDGTVDGTPSNPIGLPVAPDLELSIDPTGGDMPSGGTGSFDDPFVIMPDSTYQLTAIDATAGDVTDSSAYAVSGSTFVIVGIDGKMLTSLTIGPPFSVSAEYNGRTSNSLFFRYDSVEVLTLDVDPSSSAQILTGTGTEADPFGLLMTAPTQLLLKDAAGTDLTADINTNYSVNSTDSHAVSFSGLLTPDMAAIDNFSVAASNALDVSNSLYFRPVLVFPPILTFDISEPPVPGVGSGNDPLIVAPGGTYDLSVIGLFGAEADTESTFVVDPPSAATIDVNGVMTVDAGAGDFSVYGSHFVYDTNIIYFKAYIPKVYTFGLSFPAIGGTGTQADPFQYGRGSILTMSLGNLDGPAPNPEYSVDDLTAANIAGDQLSILPTAVTDTVFRLTATHGLDTVENGELFIRALNNPPSASFMVSQTSGTLPLDINLNGGNSSDLEDSSLSYSWDLDGDGISDQFGIDLSQAAATFLTAGDFSISLEVTDSDGGTSQTSIAIHVDGGPTWQETKVFGSGGQEANLISAIARPGIVTDGSIFQDYHYGTTSEGGGFTAVQDISFQTDIGEFSQASINVLNGRPVACYTAKDLNTMQTYAKFIKADDDLGSSWGTPVDVASGVRQGRCGFAVLGTALMVAIFVDDSDRLVSSFSLDSGSNWSTPSVIDDSAVIAPDMAVSVEDSKPCVLYHNGTEVVYRVGDDALGINWTSPAQVVKTAATASGFALTVAVNPVAAWIDTTTPSQVKLNYGTRINNVWAAIYQKNQGPNPVAPELALIHGKPGLLFCLSDGIHIMKAHGTDARAFTQQLKISDRIPGGLGLAQVGSLIGVSLTDPNHVSDNGTFYIALY